MLLYFPRRHQDDIHLVVLSADYMQEFRCHPLEHLLLNHLSFIKVLQCLQWQKEKSRSFFELWIFSDLWFSSSPGLFTVNMEETEMTKSHSYFYFSYNPTPPSPGSCLNTMVLNPGCMFITCGACPISTVDLWNQNFWGLSLNTDVFFEVLKIF